MTAEEFASLRHRATLKERQVALTELPNGVRVSTVFLNLKPSVETEAPEADAQWETLILGGPYNDEGEQYMTLEDATAGHDLWVMAAKGELTPEAIREMRTVTTS